MNNKQYVSQSGLILTASKAMYFQKYIKYILGGWGEEGSYKIEFFQLINGYNKDYY